jgi:hypothetical protein
MNSEMYGKEFELTSDVLNELSVSSDNETLENLKKTKKVSYSNAKKILHDINQGKFNGLSTNALMEFLKRILNTKRDSIKTSKKTRHETGMANTFLKSHQKNNVRDLNRPSKSHTKIYEQLNEEVLVELRRINEIINQIF